MDQSPLEHYPSPITTVYLPQTQSMANDHNWRSECGYVGLATCRGCETNMFLLFASGTVKKNNFACSNSELNS